MSLTACNDVIRNNFDAVKSEFPNSQIYSETPDPGLLDWVVVIDGKIYAVHVESQTIKYTNLLVCRHDPSNPSADMPVAPGFLQKSDSTRIDSTKVDTAVRQSSKGNNLIDTTKH